MNQTYLLNEWEPVKNAIEKMDLKTVIMDLHYDENNGLFNQLNREKFQTSVTPEPIILGFSESAGTPFMIIRFIDAITNTKAGIPDNATSFLIITIVHIPHCGYEYMMQEIQWGKDIESGQFYPTMRTEMNLDCGQAITDYVVKLITGELEGKKIR